MEIYLACKQRQFYRSVNHRGFRDYIYILEKGGSWKCESEAGFTGIVKISIFFPYECV